MLNILHEHTSIDNRLYIISIASEILVTLADDIDLIAGSNTDLQGITKILVTFSKSHGIEIRQDNSKTIVNSKNNENNTQIYMDGMIIEDVKTFKYLGSTLKPGG